MGEPRLLIMGGCNGAGKTTLARELLPMLGIARFLNADEIARGLSPLDISLANVSAGRLLLSEVASLIQTGKEFAMESTLSGRAQVRLIQRAKESGYRFVLHYVLLDSAKQSSERVKLRTSLGGHDVPEADLARRFDRSVANFCENYLPLADDWVVWENSNPPARQIASDQTHSKEQIIAMLKGTHLQETPDANQSEQVRLGLEASRRATAKMLDYYRRMGVKVTPQMTLADPDEVLDVPRGVL